ncbi:hypothetical protein PM3016_3497 [Paenibacillus mucilaginosus 3016]|uniref:Uncharacterized protein n=2 Tax=Paenibacillus mucilaginosus TaxID=61624 RepID=H6NLE8_9BACL|nr:hypothetical protein [Paenibacillus mucilaginosus]AFC30330.1 hypothetical protein PM3016_3497 [Paenibacillus mucilaginosus 3016]AFH62598.1 hypothetical protein B2K_18040 [Paenibacillus mucilaginosus K02]AFK65271.1 hypothetical protein [Paenibacillus mucilaginosus K02]WFA18966.1 hypothetical protein ERY13_17635 [Paenibacillus mucilaginosus]
MNLPRILLPALLLFTLSAPSPAALHAEPKPGRIELPKERMSTPQELAAKAEIVVAGSLEDDTKAYPTGRRVGSRPLIHYVQTFRIRSVLHGTAVSSGRLELLTDGFDPLPLPADPLNLSYTGPLVQGDYVCFLRRVPQTNLYYLAGGWQGLYPLQGTRVIALEKQGGFAAFGGMTLEELKVKLEQLQHP